MKRQPLKIPYKPLCKCLGFTCKSCNHKQICFRTNRRYTCIRILKYDSWDKIEHLIQKAKSRNRPICLITNRPLPDSLIWDIAYSQCNLLQMQVYMPKDSGDWVSGMLHLAERCGVYTTVVLHSIIPLVVSPSKLIGLIDSLRGCTHYDIVLNFSSYHIYGNLKKCPFIRVKGSRLTPNYFTFVRDSLWRCADSYVRQIVNIVKFYLESSNVKLIVCRRNFNETSIFI